MADIPFNRSVSVTCTLTPNSNVAIEYCDDLELSLDCIACKRRQRTILFEFGEPWAVCTPKEKCTGFCGRLMSIDRLNRHGAFVGAYYVSYAYMPFLDLKRGDESTGFPIWSRVHFYVSCPNCRDRFPWSTQTNIVRPFTKTCACGHALFTESVEMPIIEQLAIDIGRSNAR